MTSGMAAGILALVVAVQAADGQACKPESTPSTDVPPPASTSGVFTTNDGVRFNVETLVTNLQIPWAMSFAPDRRLFVTERPGRVRIIDLSTRTSEIALTLDDVFTEG